MSMLRPSAREGLGDMERVRKERAVVFRLVVEAGVVPSRCVHWHLHSEMAGKTADFL